MFRRGNLYFGFTFLYYATPALADVNVKEKRSEGLSITRHHPSECPTGTVMRSGACVKNARYRAKRPEHLKIRAPRKGENLQKVPNGISVMSARQLTNRHVVSMVDLSDGAVPSLRVAQSAGRNSALIVNMRGIGVMADSNQPARDQGVGIYIDGVYIARPQALGTALIDVEKLEVLKGPQGTEFGRNTEAGALRVVTRKPTGKFGVRMTGGFGNYGQNNGAIHIDLPAYKKIAVKIDAVTASRGPLIENQLSGTGGFNQYDKHGVRVEALWKPMRGFIADYAFDTSYDSTTSLWMQLLQPGSNPRAADATLQGTRAKTSNIGVPQKPSVGTNGGHRLTLEWQAIPQRLGLRSITAFRQLRQSQYDNGRAAGSMSNLTGDFAQWDFARSSLSQIKQHQISQEVQAFGHIDRLKYSGGIFYFRERASDTAQAFYTNQFIDAAGSDYQLLAGSNPDGSGRPVDRASHVTSSSLGVYGHAVYTPNIWHDRLHIAAGLRWSRDAKKGALTTVNNATPVTTSGVRGPIALDAAWSRVDPMVTLSADLTRNVMLYGRWSTGFKPGGANSRSQDYRSFQPESVSVFELGTKSDFFDHHLRVNVDGYWGNYNDIQVDFSQPYQIGNQLTTRTTTSTINAPGRGNMHGIEADVQFVPIRHVTVGFSYAFNHVHIPPTANPYPNTAGVINAFPVPIYQSYTPQHSGNVQVDYRRSFRRFKFLAHLDGNIDSGYYADSADPLFVSPGNPQNVSQPKGDSGFIVNGRIAIADIRVGSTGAKTTFSLWSRNLFAQQNVYFKNLNVTTGLRGYFNEPRQFGGQIDVSF